MNKNIFEPVIPNFLSSIVKRAVWDYKKRNLLNEDKNKDYVKAHAEEWLTGEECKLYCEIINIDYNKMIKKLGIRGGN